MKLLDSPIWKYVTALAYSLALGSVPAIFVSTAVVGFVGNSVCEHLALEWPQSLKCDEAVASTRNDFTPFFWLVFTALITTYAFKHIND